MRDLTEQINEKLLPRVARPSQYIGQEINARRADVRQAAVRVVLAFPDAYTVGISHLGSQVLYQMLNHLPGVACDRTYCPFPDAERVCREQGLPLFAWESRCAVRDFDLLGFSLSQEMCVTNVLTMLDLAGVPLRSAHRGRDDPIVVAGDALAESPEPMADFIDLFIPGDGEQPLADLVRLIGDQKARGESREAILLAAAREIPSIYAPRFYRPVGQDGHVRPIREDVPPVIERAHLPALSDSPALTAPLVPLSEAVHDRVAIEIMRGCPNACRFCQAGATRLPVRTRSVEEVVSIARKALAASGWREISLVSLSSSDYPHLAELIERINAEFAGRHVSVSLPSLRAGEQLRHLPRLTSTVRKSGLTIAPEAGSERLRRAIGKPITVEDMLAGVQAAYRAGWRRVKLYFMAGLPGETQADIDGIFHLSKRLSDTRREVDGKPGNISAAVSWFVPKPHTPMQWFPMRDAEYYFRVRRRLRELSRGTPVSFKFHRIERSILEGVLCRGDRRLGSVIEAAWRDGARMDSWNEYFDWQRWRSAFEAVGVDPAAVAQREIPLDEPLPWSHIRGLRDERSLRAAYRTTVRLLRDENPEPG